MVIKGQAFIWYCFFWGLLGLTSHAQGSWEKVDVPTGQFLRSVFFTDSLYGWATGDTGTIIHTSDGGNSWEVQDSQTTNEIYEVFFLNRDTGWASSFNFTNLPYGTWLLKTTNGGQDWSGDFYPDDNIFISCILFTDAQNGWMGGWPHALVNTQDGGASWTQAAIDTTPLAFFPVLNIQFYNDQYGYACGGIHDIAGVVWTTTNGGVSWTPVDAPSAPIDEVFQLHLYDSLQVIGAGGDPDFGYGVAFVRTNDGGLNWDYEEIGIQGNAFDIDFRDGEEAWCPLGPQRKLIYSLDAGDSWTAMPTPDSTAIFDMIFPDSLHGWGVGQDGAVIRYIPPTPVGMDAPKSFGNKSSLLKQNQPNPFGFATRIGFTVPGIYQAQHIHEVEVVLSVLSASGKLLDRIEFSKLSPGDYAHPLEAGQLPPGIYFCRLEMWDKKTGWNRNESIRMIRLNQE